MLEEDEGFGDITSNSVIEDNEYVKAYIVSKDEGILAGIDIAKELFESRDVHVLFHLADGCEIKKGDLLMSLARLDFPEPDRPVNTISLSRGMVRSTFFKLFSLAP